MATQNGPGEDVSPIKHGDFNCHVSSPEGIAEIKNSTTWTIYSLPSIAHLFCSSMGTYRIAMKHVRTSHHHHTPSHYTS